MKRLLVMLLALMLLIPSLALAQSKEEMDAEVGVIFKKYSTTGGALIIAKDNDIIYSRYYGYANKASKLRSSEESYFRIASVTKMVSALRVMQLVEQGVLDLDADISEYLGYTVVNPHYPSIPITLRTLMTHTSSLSTKGGYTNERNTLSDLIAKKSKHPNNFKKEKPGSVYRYSNFGAGVMGAIVEAATGVNMNTSLTEGVFAPLGIDGAYNPNLLQHPENISGIYNKAGKSVIARKYLMEPWDDTVNPDKHYRTTVGGIWLHPVDLARLGMMLCNGGTLDGVQVLQQETVEEMCSSQMGKGVVTVDSPYGLCINRVDNLLEGKMLYGHQGLINATLCNVYFDSETNFVFTMVTNGCDTSMNDHIAKLSRKMFAWAWDTFNQ